MKFDRLFQQDFKIVENKKKIFIIPAVIVVLALILGIIFRFTLGEAVNVGMDFTGGYSMTVTLGSELTDDNFADYEEKAKQIAKDLTDEEGNNYGLVISSVQRQGEASEAALLLKYKAVDKADAEKWRKSTRLSTKSFPPKCSTFAPKCPYRAVSSRRPITITT